MHFRIAIGERMFWAGFRSAPLFPVSRDTVVLVGSETFRIGDTNAELVAVEKLIKYSIVSTPTRIAPAGVFGANI